MRKVSRKRKISFKKIFKLLIPLIVFILLIINMNNLIYLYQSKTTGYDFNTIKLFHKLDIYNDIKKYKYSDTLNKIINTECFDKKNAKFYAQINYINNDDYFKNINEFIKLGYNSNDINLIYDNLDDKDIELLIKHDYLKDIVNILELSYFHSDKFSRYIEYNDKFNLNYTDTVTYVNIGLDKDYYTDIVKEENTDDILILVNKYHALDSKYIPKDLEKIDNKYNRGNNNLMRKAAKEAFEKMCEGALKDNITIYSGSAYRSYNYQLNLYNRYVKADGKKIAETYAARAGHSEHQTGLATDIMNAKLEFISGSDKEYTWLVNNSYKYGFILRYPKGKEDITGYMYEEWHYRYLGVDTATKVYESGLTYDEYIARQDYK